MLAVSARLHVTRWHVMLFVAYPQSFPHRAVKNSGSRHEACRETVAR